MKLLSVSVGLLLAALGIFFVPVSFAVDGFGLVVSPGGVRTVRASEAGQVLHFPSQGGRFQPGQIVTAVIFAEAVAKNALLEGTLHRELAKVESDYLDKHSKLFVDLERDRAKRAATAERLSARTVLIAGTSDNLVALREFTRESLNDIAKLNEERLEQLRRLEDLLKRSGEIAALPAQRLAAMLEDIQSDRLSVITSKGSRFASDKKIYDMVKVLNDLTYSNSIDTAEIEILSSRLGNLSLQMHELDVLRQSQRTEAAARYLAKALLPQVAVSDGVAVDMRTLQASRADVARNDALRLLETRDPASGLSVMIYGMADTGEVRLRYGMAEMSLSLPIEPDQVADALRAGGLDVAQVFSDRQVVGATDVHSVFAVFATAPSERLVVVAANGRDVRDVPVMVNTQITLIKQDKDRESDSTNEIIGFLENRHAVVLVPGQRVRGSISDPRTGAEIVFDAHLLDRDYATVDTKELGIRLGNESLAAKIIKRGVLSQVVVGVDADSAQQIEHLPGAVVHLSFPLVRQSLFSFLLARDASI